MYTTFYQLSGWPFQQVPSRRFFFASGAHRHAAAAVGAGIRRGEGVIVLTGVPGTGKSTLIDFLCAELANERLVLVRMGSPPGHAAAVPAAIATALGLDGDDAPDVQIRQRLLESRGGQPGSRQRWLIVVDDAHRWPAAALAALVPMLDLKVDGQPVVQVLLVGTPALDELLGRVELASLSGRLVARERLAPVAAGEVRGYIEYRLGQVGWHGDPSFDVDAVATIAAHSAGLPRRINQLCSRLMALGALEQRHQIDAAAVTAALAEEATEALSVSPAAADPPTDVTGPATDPSLEAAPMAPPREPEPNGSEISRLQRKLEQAYDDLSSERRRCEALRAEVDRLRKELHQVELERLRVDAETARRAVEVLASAQEPDTSALFRRFAGTDR